MHVENFFRTRLHPAVLVLGLGATLTAVSGCHRSPAPDVMATVNGKEIGRAELEKYYTAKLGDAPQERTAEQANIVRLNVLREMIDDEILQQRAAKLNLAASDSA